MQQMKAWVLERPGHLVFSQMDIPECRSDEVLIHILAVSICNGSDPALFQGSEAYKAPYVFGHEAVGVIERVGKDVRGFSPGQRVVWWCSVGAFAEYAAINPQKVAMFEVLPGIPDEHAAILELVIAAGRAQMPFFHELAGKKLRILGLGPSGLVNVMIAKALGCAYIEGWDLREDRCALARRLGAHHTRNSGQEGFSADDLPKADLSLDMAADDPIGNSLTLLCRCAKERSVIVSYGHPMHGRHFSPYVFQRASLSLVSPENDLDVIRQKGQDIMHMVECGQIRLQPLIHGVYDFGQLGDCFAKMLADPYDRLKMVFRI